MVAHVCHPSTRETEAASHHELEATSGYKVSLRLAVLRRETLSQKNHSNSGKAGSKLPSGSSPATNETLGLIQVLLHLEHVTCPVPTLPFYYSR